MYSMSMFMSLFMLMHMFLLNYRCRSLITKYIIIIFWILWTDLFIWFLILDTKIIEILVLTLSLTLDSLDSLN